MQQIVGLVLILFGLGWLACEMPTAPAKQLSPVEVTWRRTCEGWERANWLRDDLSREPPALHPAILALVLLLFALAALMGLSSDVEQETTDRIVRLTTSSGP